MKRILPNFNQRDLDNEVDEIRIEIYDLLKNIQPEKIELEEEELLYFYSLLFEDKKDDEEDDNNNDDEGGE